MNVSVDIESEPPKAAAPRKARRWAARDKRVVLYGLSLFLDCGGLVVGYLAALSFRDQAWLNAGGQPIIALALPVFLMIEIAREVQCIETLESRSLATQRALSALLEADRALKETRMSSEEQIISTLVLTMCVEEERIAA